ncbi:hypothetical protein STEG23_020638 [Scotinomys teguina]
MHKTQVQVDQRPQHKSVTLNLIEEKVGSTLERIGTGDHFLNITPTAQTLSATINQWDYMKLRSFCKAKDTVTKTKHQPTEWENIFTNPTSDRGLISRIYKELKKHDIKTPNSPIEKMGYRTKQRIYSRRISNGGKTLKEMLNILTHQREMQIKTSLRYHLTPVRMAKIKTLRTVHVGEDVEQEEHSSTVGMSTLFACMPGRASDPIKDGYEPPCGCWELNSGPLEEHPVFLTAEPSLQFQDDLIDLKF